MNQNILESPIIQIDALKTKFDTVVVSNSLIALLDYDYNQARFLQQLHYWSYSKYGVVIDGIRWIYKSAREWLTEVLVGLTEWKLRRAIASLLKKKLIRREKLYVRHHEQEYQSPWWNPKNQTYYYSINYQELQRLIDKAKAAQKAETTLNHRIEEFTELSVEEFITTETCELSRNNTKITTRKKTNKAGEIQPRQSLLCSSIAAASFKLASSNSTQNQEQVESTLPLSTKQPKQSSQRQKTRQKQKPSQVDEKAKSKLGDLGIRLNPTLVKLIKNYPKEKIESAIALVRARKRENYIPNAAGYFTQALKGEWASKLVQESGSGIDSASVFRHWYDLARELGYCSGQEMREGEQWICLSGSWEKWEDAVNRGYSLEYLKKIIKRNQGQ